MSWILGTIGTISEKKKQQLISLQPQPLYSVKTGTLSLAAGGIPATCFHGKYPEKKYGKWDGWIAAGLGMHQAHDGCILYSSVAWNSFFDVPEPGRAEVDGHFTALRYNEHEVQVFTDQLGLRGFYAAKMDEGVVFSTRLDWVARLSGNCEIETEAFGPQWIAFNQISYDSPIRHVYRLGPGGTGKCTPQTIHFESAIWPQNGNLKNDLEFEDAVRSFLVPKNISQEQISFGLSGGLDSRVLLALYASMKNPKIKLHVFGDEHDPDVIISSKIGNKTGLEHTHEQYFPKNQEELLTRMREYLSQIYVTSPASAVFNAGAVDKVASRSAIILDGSFGEIARRQCFNRLLMKGSKAIQKRSACEMSSYMTVHRADIFCCEAMEEMNRGHINQIRWYLDSLPAGESGPQEDFVDLLTIRTRFPNYSGVEQSRTDAVVMGYMPFLQPSVLRTVFRIPMELKRNGKLFRRLIQQHAPELAAFPLVKGGTTYPFSFSTVPAHIWTQAKKRIYSPFADARIPRMLETVKEYIRDIVHSTELHSAAGYDIQKVRRLIERYYAGEKKLQMQVDWWLSFELWRQSMREKN